MWLCTKTGFFSVVIDRQRPGRMLVRARCRQDIENLYEMAKDLASIEKPTSDESRDYRYRMSVDREDWLRLACRSAQRVDYDNFKSAVAKEPSQQNKLEAYHEVWAALPKCSYRNARNRNQPSAKRGGGNDVSGTR